MFPKSDFVSKYHLFRWAVFCSSGNNIKNRQLTMSHRLCMYLSVKGHEFLCSLITFQSNESSCLSGQHCKTAESGTAKTIVQCRIKGFKIIPETAAFFESIRCAYLQKIYTANGHHNREKTYLIAFKLHGICTALAHIYMLHDVTCYVYLLVNTFDVNRLINGLILSADEVMVEINVQIADSLYMMERLTCKYIIYIEHMLRQLYA